MSNLHASPLEFGVLFPQLSYVPPGDSYHTPRGDEYDGIIAKLLSKRAFEETQRAKGMPDTQSVSESTYMNASMRELRSGLRIRRLTYQSQAR